MQKLRAKSLLLSGPYGYESLVNISKTDEKEDRSGIITFFYQGHGASRAQAASYTGEDGVDVLKNNQFFYHAVCPGAPKIIHNAYPYNELSEIGYEKAYNPLYIAEKIMSSLRNLLVNMQGALPYYLDLSQVSLAGDLDIAQFVTYYEKMVKEFPKRHHVVFGTSRGASTVITGVSSLSLKLQTSIALVIAEAPFDSVASVLQKSSIFPEIQQKGLKTTTAYRDDQETPLEAIERFPLFVPIAFVTSKVDKRVPPKCTEQLIARLRERGHTMVHHLELERSHHSVMSLQDKDDVSAYCGFVNDLYGLYCAS